MSLLLLLSGPQATCLASSVFFFFLVHHTVSLIVARHSVVCFNGIFKDKTSVKSQGDAE